MLGGIGVAVAFGGPRIGEVELGYIWFRFSRICLCDLQSLPFSVIISSPGLELDVLTHCVD